MTELELKLPENTSVGGPATSLTTLPASELYIYDHQAFTESIFWIIGVAVIVFGVLLFVREKFGEFIERDK